MTFLWSAGSFLLWSWPWHCLGFIVADLGLLRQQHNKEKVRSPILAGNTNTKPNGADHRLEWEGSFSPFRYFPSYSEFGVPNEHHAHICQVSPQFSCGDICQIWRWQNGSNIYMFVKVEICLTQKLTNAAPVTPIPASWTRSLKVLQFHLGVEPSRLSLGSTACI